MYSAGGYQSLAEETYSEQHSARCWELGWSSEQHSARYWELANRWVRHLGKYLVQD